MASGSQAAVDGGCDRSGGKILKRRRTAAGKTPYDRPIPPPQPENPNWLNGLVFPAKFVAGGASKLLSSFWNPKSWGSRSSSSNSGSDSEDGIEDVLEDNDDLSDGVDELNRKKSSSSRKSEILHLVEQLLMLERYSREECARLIEIINSRVVYHTMAEEMDAGPSKILSTTDIETPDIHNQAIMEAKELIMKNKVGSSSKSDLDNGMHGSKSVLKPHISKGEAGSPVDVAKSYMQTRPPWVSPLSHSDPPTPLKEGPPYSSIGRNSLSLAKRDNLSGGSWNIQDEVRRLRSKATEDLLSNHRSTELLEQSVGNDKVIEVTKENESNFLESPKTEDETMNPISEEDKKTAQDDVPTERLSSLPTIPEQNQMVEEQNPRLSGEENNAQSDEIKQDHERPNNEDKTGGDFNGSQGSSPNPKTNKLRVTKKGDAPIAKRAVTRSTRYNTQRVRGRARGK